MQSQIVTVLGSSFGDEGKARIIDYLSDRFDYVVRYQGGDNAGHSVFLKDKKFVLQLIPSGIFKTKSVIASGVAFNPESFMEEAERLKNIVVLEDRLFVSSNASVICDWNISCDKLLEKIRGSACIGTTLKGIGPTYASTVLRIGLKVSDLFCKENLREKIGLNLSIFNPLFLYYNFPIFDLEACVSKYYSLGEKIKKYVVDSFELLHSSVKQGKRLLFEGSQGLLLDLDMGTYPFVTSSNVYAFLSSGTGLPFKVFSESALGVVKAYMTRVGNGVLVTEIDDCEISNHIRVIGNEYGSVTGRERRIGWLDLVAIKYACLFSGISKIALTLVDVLNDLKEVKVCVDYLDENGKSVNWDNSKFKKIFPVYKSFNGWSDDYSNIKKYSDFSKEFRDYAEFISDFLNVKISLISYGKDKNRILEL